MSKKVTITPGVIYASNQTDFDNFPNGFIHAVGDFAHAPNGSFNGEVETHRYDLASTQRVLDYNTGKRFERMQASGVWYVWEPMPTATPPQEFPLPLAEGLELMPDGQLSVFRKDQVGWVDVTVAIAKTPLGTPAMIAGSLPVGFLPVRRIGRPCTVQNNGAFSSALCTIDPSGAIELHIYTPQVGVGYAYAQVGFYAAPSGPIAP